MVRWTRALVRLAAVGGAAVLLAAACSSSPGTDVSPSTPTPAPFRFTHSGQIYDALAAAGFACSKKPTLFNGGALGTCGPIASVAGSNLSIGVYPAAAIAEAQYMANCKAPGWSLYRSGLNWRGIITWEGAAFPEATARSIADALGTDVHGPCASQVPLPTTPGASPSASP